jgi:predicted O-methyltransferase YrrM
VADLRIEKHRRKHPRFLASLLESPKIGAEIGVERGTTTRQLLTAFPGLHMIAVDAWAAHEPYEDWPMEEIKREFLTCAESLPGRITIMNTSSVSAAKKIPDGSLDFVFIDAEHTYEAVIQDIAAWAPKVRDGGFVTGHDYSRKCPGVRLAVDEIYPQASVDCISAVWWVRC